MRQLNELDVRTTSLPDVRLLDVTLRDGGFRTDFHWSENEMETIAGAVSEAGAHIVELGYLGGVPELHNAKHPGIAADVPVELVARIHEKDPSIALALMIHPKAASSKRIDFDAYRRRGLQLIRMVFHPSWYEELRQLVANVRSSGLSVAINIALASRYTPEHLHETIDRAAVLTPDILYLADTCSALLPDEVTGLYRSLENLGLPLGFHAHDFLSLALSNSLAAANGGASYVDASLLGFGRGAGNLRLELWLAIVAARSSQKVRLTPLIGALEEVLLKRDGAKAADFTSIVSGALNLSPPQEDVLRGKFANSFGSAARAAAHLIDNFHGATSLAEAFARACHRSAQ
jgi:4-hydroxy 2-oxovalerate aldolase